MMQIRGVLLAVCLVLVFTACNSDEDSDIISPEGIFINELYASGDDWLELYNASESPKDISGYFIYDNPDKKYPLPSGTVINGKGFLVLLCNDLGTGLNTNFRLTEAGETVYLDNAAGNRIDQVKFPALRNGQSYARFPDGSSNFAITGSPTRGASNGDRSAPAILDVTRNPLVPGLNQSVTITASLSTATGIASVKLYYRFNTGAFTEIPMTGTAASFTGTIPGINETGKVDYYIEVRSTSNIVSFEPDGAPSKTLSYLLNTDPLPVLVINEFMAFNRSCCPDITSGTEEFDDWIEIYNAGSTSVQLGGMYVSDDRNNPFKYRIPDNQPSLTLIPAGGHLVIWADNSPEQGPLHTTFALNNAGEDVALFYLDGRTIDAYTFGPQLEDQSWGRTTDGATTWKSFVTPTPGKPNQ
jgi:hypothetical protein